MLLQLESQEHDLWHALVNGCHAPGLPDVQCLKLPQIHTGL